MDYKFSIRNNKLSDIITIKKDGTKNVQTYKNELSQILSIKPQYLILKYDSTDLENEKFLNDYNITDNDCIVIKLEVVIRDLKENKSCLFQMEYDETFSDLKEKYCDTVQIKTFQLKCEGEYCENKNIRDYLKKSGCFFSVSLPITVTVTNESGNSFDLIFFWNDTAETVLAKLKKENAMNDGLDKLMIGDHMFMKHEELYSFRNVDPFIIFVGIYIAINNGEQHMTVRLVNVNTKISQLKGDLSEKFGLDINMFSLMFGSQYLLDVETVGFYKLKSGDQLSFILNEKILVVSVNEDNVMELIVKKFQTIKDVKEELSEKCAVSSARIILRSNNEELSNESTIESLQFNDTTILEMELNRDEEGYLLAVDDEERRSESIGGKLIFGEDILQNTDLRTPSFTGIDDTMEGGSDFMVESSKNKDIEPVISSVCIDGIENEVTIDVTKGSNDEVVHQDVEVEGVIKVIEDEEVKNQSNEDVIKEEVETKVLEVEEVKNLTNEDAIKEQEQTNEELKDQSNVGVIEKDCDSKVMDEEELENESNDVWVLCDRDTLEDTPVSMSSRDQLSVNVLGTDGIVRKWEISDDETVSRLKVRLEGEYNVNVDHMKLCMDDIELSDGDVIRDVSMNSEDVLKMVVEEDHVTRIQVMVRDGTIREGARRDMSMSVNESVEEIRQRVEDMFTLSPSRYVLSINGEILTDESRDVENGNEIMISDCIKVKYLIDGDEQIKRFVFVAGDKVVDLKGRITTEMNVNSKLINFSVNGCPLEMDHLLEEYGGASGALLLMNIEEEI